MIRDKKLVADFLESKGLRAKEFSKEERTQSKTPDFRVFHEQGFAFFCEVKSLFGDDWVNQQLEVTNLGNDDDASRHDPTYNRVSQKIHEAVKQFNAVNQDLVHPNVLVFINHVEGSDVLDLSIVCTGGVITDSGKWLPIGRKFSEGRIRDKKRRIHLFIWIDDFNGGPKHYLRYNREAQEYLDSLCDYFGSDPASIRASRS